MSKKIGFELELFVTKKKKLVSPVMIDKKLPHDGSLLQLELRGKPFDNVEDAYFSVLAELAKIKPLLKGYAVLKNVNWWEKTPETDEVLQEAIRNCGMYKEISWHNLYDFKVSTMSHTHYSAGLHVHLSNKDWTYHKNKRVDHNAPFDFPKDFRAIETEFNDDILEAHRTTGFYEMKGHGVEYRSLPMSIFFKHDFIQRIKKCELL